MGDELAGGEIPVKAATVEGCDGNGTTVQLQPVGKKMSNGTSTWPQPVNKKGIDSFSKIETMMKKEVGFTPSKVQSQVGALKYTARREAGKDKVLDAISKA